MTYIEITVLDLSGVAYYAEIPDDITDDELVKNLVQEFDLPVTDGTHTLRYGINNIGGTSLSEHATVQLFLKPRLLWLR